MDGRAELDRVVTHPGGLHREDALVGELELDHARGDEGRDDLDAQHVRTGHELSRCGVRRAVEGVRAALLTRADGRGGSGTIRRDVVGDRAGRQGEDAGDRRGAEERRDDAPPSPRPGSTETRGDRLGIAEARDGASLGLRAGRTFGDTVLDRREQVVAGLVERADSSSPAERSELAAQLSEQVLERRSRLAHVVPSRRAFIPRANARQSRCRSLSAVSPERVSS